MKRSKRYYAVARGRRPGLYTSWDGPDGAKRQVLGFPGALYKGFSSREDAMRFLENPPVGGQVPAGPRAAAPDRPEDSPRPEAGVVVYTDGGCIDNPGPGGWAAVILRGDERTEMSGGFRLTTNNRMELTACIQGLRSLGPEDEDAVVFTDSRYLVDAVEKGWARRWRSRGWMRDRAHRALNEDLWEELLCLLDRRRVVFRWVRGHAGDPENERCDELAREAARRRDLPADAVYERLMGLDAMPDAKTP